MMSDYYEHQSRTLEGYERDSGGYEYYTGAHTENQYEDMSDKTLEARAKELLTELRAVQREIVRRYHARQTPAKAICGHDARDKTGLCCDCPECANYTPF